MENTVEKEKAVEVLESIRERVKKTLPELDDLQLEKVAFLCCRTSAAHLNSFLVMGLMDRLDLSLIFQVAEMNEECTRLASGQIEELENVASNAKTSACND